MKNKILTKIKKSDGSYLSIGDYVCSDLDYDDLYGRIIEISIVYGVPQILLRTVDKSGFKNVVRHNPEYLSKVEAK